ncbi:integrin beta-3-like [Lineus longissimus]|uniref:integrin beta-3-like n=1 Tax=Lineus longissimus TaxID=88925 RepID=UPI00315CE5B9
MLFGQPTAILFLALLVICLQIILGDEDCNQQLTCRECFAAASQCRWCSHIDYDKPRCGSLTQLVSGSCPSFKILRRYHNIPRSPRCNRFDEECGVCHCGEGNYGQYCECDSTVLNPEEANAQCTRSANESICSGHGQCVCGECLCNPVDRYWPQGRKYQGNYCQCDDASCDRHPRTFEQCGGPGIGKCVCGECICEPGFSGKVCDCKEDPEPCRSSSTGMICSGRGLCQCGSCSCTLDTYYSGPTCDDCRNCPGRCDELKDYVRCYVFGTGPLNQVECSNIRRDQQSYIHLTDDVVASPDTRLCEFVDDDGCTARFSYEYRKSTNVRVRVRLTKFC